jgi:predicted MFS family arabinose efflux permease
VTETIAVRASPEAAARRDWTLLAAATVAFGFGFGINLGTVPSFAADFLRIDRLHLGLLESLREVPGLLTAAIIGVLACFAEPRLATLALAVLGLGIALTGRAGGFWPLVACNVLWSIGLHVWLTVQPSLTLSLSRAGHHGHGLGMMNRYSALAIMAGLLFVRFLARPLGYTGTFLFAGLAIAAGGFFVSRIVPGRGGGITQGLVFRRRYWRYYGLMLLDGGRRQVVDTFAVLILVKEFRVSIESVAVLLLVGNALTMALAPVVGRWTDRFGERRVLTTYYALVAVIFFTYTRIAALSDATGLPQEWLFYGVYSLDKLLFTASVGIQTYIRHTAPREDLSSSLAMGLTWNHIAAVSVPLVAGSIWDALGYRQVFLYGIGLALASLGMCLTLPRHHPEVLTTETPRAEPEGRRRHGEEGTVDQPA